MKMTKVTKIGAHSSVPDQQNASLEAATRKVGRQQKDLLRRLAAVWTKAKEAATQNAPTTCAQMAITTFVILTFHEIPT